MRLLSLDPFTLDTLRRMVRYQKDDRKIAQYLDIDESYVRRARTSMRVIKGKRRRYPSDDKKRVR